MTTNLQDFSIPASAAVAALQRNQVDHVVNVPDWVQLALHARLDRGVAGIRVVPCANENQTVTVAAGLTIAGKRPLLMMQNQGPSLGAEPVEDDKNRLSRFHPGKSI